MQGHHTAVVFTGGDPVDPSVRTKLPEGAYVIAADSGLDQAAALGWPVDLAVGDFDSASDEALAAATSTGTVIERHPEAKDSTDLELGLVAAQRVGAHRVVVVGGAGGRVDHFLANALLIASPAFAGMTIEALVGAAHLTVVHTEADLFGVPGDLVSLVPIGGTARGVRTAGLLYPLAGDDLPPGTTRGVSNEFAAKVATVSITAGTLLAVQPGLPGTHLFAGITTNDTPTGSA